MLSRLAPALILSTIRRVRVAQTTINSYKSSFSTAQIPEKIAFNFNEQETVRILDIINTKSVDHLARYDIAKTKLNKLETWKLKNGDLYNLDDLLYLDGFSVKIVEKFCKSLLGEVPAKRPTRKAPAFVTPVLAETQIGKIKSSVSINVGVSSIIWSRLELKEDGPCELTHWQRHDIEEKRLHLYDLIQCCLYAGYLIPHADCYIFENPQIAQGSAPGKAEQVNINVQRAQLSAILGFALANRNSSPERAQSNVFYLRRYLAARLFQHLIGTERVSAEKIILNLMRTYNNVDDMPDKDGGEQIVDGESFFSQGNVSFPKELRSMYNEAERYHREFLGQTLLLNLAFVRLVLLRDAKSIALVSRGAKPSEFE